MALHEEVVNFLDLALLASVLSVTFLLHCARGVPTQASDQRVLVRNVALVEVGVSLCRRNLAPEVILVPIQRKVGAVRGVRPHAGEPAIRCALGADEVLGKASQHARFVVLPISCPAHGALVVTLYG